jgi:hypothetical protein
LRTVRVELGIPIILPDPLAVRTPELNHTVISLLS